MTETGIYKFLPPGLFSRLHGLEVTVRRPMDGMRQSQHRSLSLGSSVEFAEYRNYIPGDAIQRIDWAAYARSDRLVIRQTHEEVNARTYVLLDVSRSMKFRGEGPMSKMDYACYLAAGIMYMMVNQGDSASLITFDSHVRNTFPLTGSADGLRAPLLHLETINPTEPGNIEAALHEVADMVHGRTLLVLISDLLQDPNDVMRALHHFQHDGKDVTVFHVLDPSEMNLPMTGLADLSEMESGSRMTLDLDEIRGLYTAEVRRYLEELRRGCSRLRFDYVLTDTNIPHYMALRKRSAAR